MVATVQATDTERAALLQVLEEQREFLRFTVQGLSDEQARTRTTASELTLGGLVKHVLRVERDWAGFILDGPARVDGSVEDHEEGFVLGPDETLAGVVQEYQDVAEETERVVRGLKDLDVDQPLPQAPWFPEGARWSARQVLLHLIRETAQHCGHADIIRESLDGQKTMG
jgi:uncharacterized damage-inducible protein DinB